MATSNQPWFPMNTNIRSEWKEAVVPLSFAILAAAGLLSLASDASAAELTGSATLTSDYVWRGSSQTMEKPAVQAGIKLAGESGLYASAWGSNVRFASATDAASEFDLTIGWGRKLGKDWALDVSALRYIYPDTRGLDWNEVNASATWRDRALVGVGHSSNAMATHGNGTYVSAGVRIPANDELRFEAGAAHYALSDALGDYTHGWASAVWAFKAPFEARLTVHGTDGAAKARFGRDVAGTRIEAALQAAF